MTQPQPTTLNRGDILHIEVEQDQAGFYRAYTLNTAKKRHGVCYEWDIYDRLFSVSYWENDKQISYTRIE